MMYVYGAGFGLIAVIFDLLWWALIIWIFVAIMRSASRGEKMHWSRKTPLDILKERYAKGEVDTKEFEERKHLLAA